jgi:hypothetical protein
MKVQAAHRTPVREKVQALASEGIGALPGTETGRCRFSIAENAEFQRIRGRSIMGAVDSRDRDLV